MKKIKNMAMLLALTSYLLPSQISASSDDAVSGGALRLIKRFESFSSVVYRDSAGHPTIGYGHLITAGERYDGVRLSEDDGRRLLVSDMRSKSNISRYITTDLEYNQSDALTSLCFNIGAGNFSGSTVVKKVNSGDIDGAYEFFGHWRKAGGDVSRGLIKRRFAELFVFAGRDLDPSDDTSPSRQWGVAPMPVTDENWGRIGYDLRGEAVAVYNEYMSE